MIELNKQGVEILERYAAIFLTKILSGDDPNFLDIRSPGGALRAFARLAMAGKLNLAGSLIGLVERERARLE